MSIPKNPAPSPQSSFQHTGERTLEELTNLHNIKEYKLNNFTISELQTIIDNQDQFVATEINHLVGKEGHERLLAPPETTSKMWSKGRMVKIAASSVFVGGAVTAGVSLLPIGLISLSAYTAFGSAVTAVTAAALYFRDNSRQIEKKFEDVTGCSPEEAPNRQLRASTLEASIARTLVEQKVQDIYKSKESENDYQDARASKAEGITLRAVTEVDSLREKLLELKASLSSAQDELKTAQDELKGKDRELENTKRIIEDAKKRIAYIKGKKKAVESSLNDRSQELKLIKQELKHAKKEVEELTHSKQEVEELRLDLDNVHTQNRLLHQALQKILEEHPDVAIYSELNNIKPL